ncbi:MAG: sugar phosphate isomerase/epimerase [Candidatus Sumerlaeia bacterium]|nr:sugar phosphate isomerase/epimerase [Candidatus Sumerlaeia bacterium]
MKILYIKSIWGMPIDEPIDEKLRRISDAGYDGVEVDTPLMSPTEWTEMLERYNLKYVAQIFPDTAEQVVSELKRAAPYNPIRVDVHCGRDFMTFEEGSRFFREALATEKDLGLTVGHETHRARLFFAPWITSQYLEKFPDLRITADFSHWCCVCDSLLENMTEHIDLAITRAVHVHGRVGYAEGPQVPDPSAPEWAKHLALHEGWWDRIMENQRKQGVEETTFNPEFGPPGYMHTLPHTNQPVADLWQVCLWMADRQRARWK